MSPRRTRVTLPAMALAVVIAVVIVAVSACSPEPSGSPTASPTAPVSSGTAAETPSLAPTPTPSPTAEPTPNQADIPLFQAGTELKTLTTVRLRDLPGTRWGVAANLSAGAVVQAVLGPVRTDGYGWYLVRDTDPSAPTFIEGWVAAGFEPDAFLAPTGASPSPPAGAPTFVVGYAQATGGDFGPFTLGGNAALRWAVAVPTGSSDGTSCTFTGSLVPSGGAGVVFLKTTVSQAPAPGTTQPTFFTAHPTLSGDLFLHVESDCSWAVTVVRLPF